MELLLFKGAGLVSLHARKWSLHLAVYPTHWVWGRQAEDYDHCMDYVGLGPVALLAVAPGVLPNFLLAPT